MYAIGHYTLFRNDSSPSHNERPFGGTAVYSGTDYYLGYPYNFNRQNGVEITVLRLVINSTCNSYSCSLSFSDSSCN